MATAQMSVGEARAPAVLESVRRRRPRPRAPRVGDEELARDGRVALRVRGVDRACFAIAPC